MIKYFTVENFRSIKNESILEFDVNIRKEIPCTAHPLIGLAGANASGKTALLQALSFVFWFLKDSFLNQEPDEEIPLDPFCTQKQQATHFHLIFSIHNNDYEYKLKINKQKVIYESLHYYENEEQQCAYIRQDKTVTFGNKIPKISTSGLRQNSSIISYAAQDETQIIAKLCKEYIVYSNVTHGGFREEHFKHNLEKMIEDKYFQSRLSRFLPIADVGIKTIAFKKADEEELNKLQVDLQKNLDDENNKHFVKLLEMLQTKIEDIKKLVFTHNIDGQAINFSGSERESAGTLQFLTLLYRILSALEKGHLLILDEIELKLHQNLVAFLIGLFQNPDENPNCAQLIFSFHNAAFMELLKPEQLWFAEKNDDGQTELFSAADFHDIKDLHQKNLEKLYRLGRFGATPRGL